MHLSAHLLFSMAGGFGYVFAALPQRPAHRGAGAGLIPTAILPAVFG